MTKKHIPLSLVCFLIVILILVPTTEARKKDKDKDKKKDKQEEVQKTEIQDEKFEFFLNLLQGERSRDSHREYIIIKIHDRTLVYHSEFHGRPRKSIPGSFDATITLTEPQWQGLLAELQKNKLLQNFSEEKVPEGIGNYVKFKLAIKYQGQEFESNLTGMSESFSNKDNQISDTAKAFQEGLLSLNEYLKKLLPKPATDKK